MADPDSLGTFEMLVLAAVQQLGTTAYGVTIREEIERRARRDASIGAIHATLARLADKGYVTFRFSDPRPVPGGRARKYAQLTPRGLTALRSAMTAMFRMTEGLGLDRRG